MVPWLLPLVGSGTLAFAWYGTERISRPRRRQAVETPADHGMPFYDVAFPSSDGIPLRGWLIPGDDPVGTIVICHGYGSDKADGLDGAAFLRPSFNVLSFDLRGHGQSGGTRTSLGYLECRDIAGAVDFLQRERLGPLGVLGFSLGAAAAILAASQLPNLRAVAADNPFVSLAEAVRCGLVRYGYPRAFARVAAPVLAATLRWRLGIPPGAGDPIRAAPAIAPRPLLIIHGAHDGYIPSWHSQALYDAAGEPKRLWLVDGADHCQAHHCAGPLYEQTIIAFFRNAFDGTPPAHS